MPVIQFKGKTAIESYHHTVPHHTLEFDPKLSLLAKGEKPGLDGNLIIEGDNLLALKALLPTHAGRIKCIYIDPPYNTGNEGWVYNDNLTQPQFKEWIGKTVGKEGEDFTRHDKWCCMMYPRLQLLKELLRDDGAIFISIDDNELRYLLLICDEVFGPENRFGLIVVKNNPRGRRLGTELAVEHEYVVVYASKNSKFKAGRIPLTDEQIAEYSEVDSEGRKYRLLGLRKRGALSRRIDRPNLHFPLYVNKETRSVSLQKTKRLVEVIPRLSDGSDGVWRWSGKKVDEEGASLIGREVKRRDTGLLEWDVFELDYLEPAEGRLFPSLWLGSEFNYETGTDQIKEILGKVDFPYPKPVDLIKHAVLLSGATEGLILDSFAGSGTTGQAVLELNAADGADRHFVLVQMPHETKEQEQKGVNICKNITAERVKRVATGYAYKTQKGREVTIAGLGGMFTYAGVGKPLFDEYRDLGKILPSYDELAKYIFYTETSTDFDQKGLDLQTGKIGEYRKTSYYLLYTPNNKEDEALDSEWLKSIEKTEKNRNIVVYCEKIWIHRDDLAKYEKDTGRKVRPMLIPFNLK